MAKQYLTLSQLSKKLGGRSRASIYRDFQAGRIPHPIRIGGRLYWDEAAVDRRITNENGNVVRN